MTHRDKPTSSSNPSEHLLDVTLITYDAHYDCIVLTAHPYACPYAIIDAMAQGLRLPFKVRFSHTEPPTLVTI